MKTLSNYHSKFPQIFVGTGCTRKKAASDKNSWLGIDSKKQHPIKKKRRKQTN